MPSVFLGTILCPLAESRQMSGHQVQPDLGNNGQRQKPSLSASKNKVKEFSTILHNVSVGGVLFVL